MSEQELRQENERLQRELAEMRAERDNLHEMVCGMIPIEEVQLSEGDLKEMRDQNISIIDLLHDPRFADGPTNGMPLAEANRVQRT